MRPYGYFGLASWLLLASLAAPAGAANSETGDGIPTLDVEWTRLRNYVTAHAWIADIDFRKGEVQGLHVCAGFNAFREPDQLEELGFVEGNKPDAALQAAAFAIAMNAPGFSKRASGHVREILRSEDYAASSGEERLRIARARLWRSVAADEEIDAAVRSSVELLGRMTVRLAAAGLIDAGTMPERPFDYMEGMNTLLRSSDACEQALADPKLGTLTGWAERRARFSSRFLDLTLEQSGIEDPGDRADYRRNLGETLDKMFAAGGAYVLRIADVRGPTKTSSR